MTLLWPIAILLILVAVLINGRYQKQNSIKKKLAELNDKWGKAVFTNRNFKLISSYYNAFGNGKLSAETIVDIDLEGMFSYIDRTCSKPGQQYLYKELREPKTNQTHFINLEQRIEKLNKDQSLREQILLKLSELDNYDAYYLPELFLKPHKSLFNTFTESYIKVSALLTLSLLAVLIIVPNQIYLLLLLTMLVANTIIHFQNKKNVATYNQSLPQLLILSRISRWLADKNFIEQSHAMEQSLANVASLKRSLGFINLQSSAGKDPTDLSYLIFEWFNMLLLIEPLIFLSSIKKVNKYLNDIKQLYEAVAQVDVAISIQSLREGLPNYCKPDFNVEGNIINVKDLYHPLIENCVPNSIISKNNQGVLITGSNMSGKTTFIRTIAVNALLAQTVHTCCATIYQAPPLHIFTSIQITDDLEGHKSYFQAEALSVLNIIGQCAASNPIKSLVIIDEIFRGTNTIERIAAAKAVLAYLIHNQNFVFVSTHDLELAELLGKDFAVYSFEEQISKNRLVFDYKIKDGLLKNKNGIAVLQSLGYPQVIIDDAYEAGNHLRDKYNL